MQTVLITGVAGFIGSNLTEKIINENQIIGLDDFNDYYSPRIKEQNIRGFIHHKNFVLYRGDIRDENMLTKIFAEHRIDKIVHLAARAGVRPSLLNPSLYMSVNFIGTQKLLEQAAQSKIEHFIFASSSSVYGNNAKVPFSENDRIENPISPYAISKIAGEKLCWLYHHVFGTPMTILRFFSVYGPKGRPDMAPYIFTKKILNGEKIEVYGDGSQARDFTYIDDIVDGIIKTLLFSIIPAPSLSPRRRGAGIQNFSSFCIINLGNSYPIFVRELINTIEKITGKKAKIKYQEKRLGDVEKTFANIAKAEKLLNWRPQIGILEGLKKYISWYRTHNL